LFPKWLNLCHSKRTLTATFSLSPARLVEYGVFSLKEYANCNNVKTNLVHILNYAHLILVDSGIICILQFSVKHPTDVLHDMVAGS